MSPLNVCSSHKTAKVALIHFVVVSVEDLHNVLHGEGPHSRQKLNVEINYEQHTKKSSSKCILFFNQNLPICLHQNRKDNRCNSCWLSVYFPIPQRNVELLRIYPEDKNIISSADFGRYFSQ